MQHLMRIDGVIVDLVREITEAVTEYMSPGKGFDEKISSIVEETEKIGRVKTKPQFSQRQLSFLLKLIPELINH